MDDPSKLVADVAFQLLRVKYVNVASITFLLFDWIQTFEREFTLMWQKRWDLRKVLFMVSRYSALLDVTLVMFYYLLPDPTPYFCVCSFSAVNASTAIGLAFAQAILVIHACILWEMKKPILIFLGLLQIAIGVTVTVTLVLFLARNQFGPPPTSVIIGCFPTQRSRLIIVNFAGLALNEFILSILALWVGFKKAANSSKPLLVVLHEHGILFFIYIFAMSTAELFIQIYGFKPLGDLFATLLRVCHSVFSTRLLLQNNPAWPEPPKQEDLELTPSSSKSNLSGSNASSEAI